MKKTSLAVLVSLAALAGVAHAQESEHIQTITDPAKIAEIEARAQALRDQPQQPAPMAHEEMHHERARHEHHHHHVAKKHDKAAK